AAAVDQAGRRPMAPHDGVVPDVSRETPVTFGSELQIHAVLSATDVSRETCDATGRLPSIVTNESYNAVFGAKGQLRPGPKRR
ncbi:MAG: hypothetical protein MK074_09470, partial [Phycisphaerales bacterium]|nr:hypothetical protein [Phycisphaerales bacterium]